MKGGSILYLWANLFPHVYMMPFTHCTIVILTNLQSKSCFAQFIFQFWDLVPSTLLSSFAKLYNVTTQLITPKQSWCNTTFKGRPIFASSNNKTKKIKLHLPFVSSHTKNIGFFPHYLLTQVGANLFPTQILPPSRKWYLNYT